MKTWIGAIIILLVVMFALVLNSFVKDNENKDRLCEEMGYTIFNGEDGQGNINCCKMGYNETFNLYYTDYCDWISIKGD